MDRGGCGAGLIISSVSDYVTGQVVTSQIHKASLQQDALEIDMVKNCDVEEWICED
ncbi:MAG: hypothetical protein ACOX2M_08650 [Fastidiosipilaceae bacterium]|jgi:hypothetical protein